MSSTITLRLPEKTKRELIAIADSLGINFSQLLRQSFNKTIAAHSFKKIREKTIAKAQKVGIFTDEDILNLPS